MTRSAMVVCAYLCGMAGGVAAQAPAPQASLGTVKTLQCSLTQHSAVTWKSGEPQADAKPIQMALRYEDVDTDNGAARFVGSSGRADVAVRFVRDSLTFIHSAADGSVALTSVARPAPKGRWLAVHTRHEFSETSPDGITIGPAQYYGTCAIER